MDERYRQVTSQLFKRMKRVRRIPKVPVVCWDRVKTPLDRQVVFNVSFPVRDAVMTYAQTQRLRRVMDRAIKRQFNLYEELVPPKVWIEYWFNFRAPLNKRVALRVNLPLRNALMEAIENG